MLSGSQRRRWPARWRQSKRRLEQFVPEGVGAVPLAFEVRPLTTCNVLIFASRMAVPAGRADADRTEGEHGLAAVTPLPRQVDLPSRRPGVFKRVARLVLVSCSRMRQLGNGAVTA
jgi:hypothetical protein